MFEMYIKTDERKLREEGRNIETFNGLVRALGLDTEFEESSSNHYFLREENDERECICLLKLKFTQLWYILPFIEEWITYSDTEGKEDELANIIEGKKSFRMTIEGDPEKVNRTNFSIDEFNRIIKNICLDTGFMEELEPNHYYLDDKTGDIGRMFVLESKFQRLGYIIPNLAKWITYAEEGVTDELEQAIY